MLPSKVVLSSDALFQNIDDEGVILDLASSSYFGVDGTGVRLWELLQDNSCLESTINQLLKEFDVSRCELEADTAEFIRELVEAGLASVE